MTSISTSPLVILGCGYVGARLARAALADGRVVRVCARSTGRLAPLADAGAQVKYLDAAIVKQLPLVVGGMHGATVVYSIPPASSLRPGQAVRSALQAAHGVGATCFVYLSSSGLYGSLPDDEVWIDEDSPVVRDDPSMLNCQADETEIDNCMFERLRTTILRLAPVYGPGRGVRERLRNQTYKLLDEGQHAISRIHVDDVVRVIFAAEQRAPAKARYLVADDEPTTQAAYARWLCDRMGLEMPPSRGGESRTAHRNRRIRNTRLKQDLAIELRYPTFRDGEAAIEAEAASA